jgi:hypothetical protein
MNILNYTNDKENRSSLSARVIHSRDISKSRSMCNSIGMRSNFLKLNKKGLELDTTTKTLFLSTHYSNIIIIILIFKVKPLWA